MLVERYGKTFRHLGLVMTCEPAAVRAILTDRAHVETRPKVHKLMAMLPGARGVLFMDGEPWRTRARALAPVFHRQNVADSSAIVHDIATRHVSSWARAGRGEDLYTSVQRLGTDAVMQIGFGFDSANPHAAALAASLVVYKNHSMDPRPELRLDKLTLDSATLVRCPYIVARLWRYHRDVRAALCAALANGKRTGRTDWICRLQDAQLSRRALANEVNHLYGAFNAIDYISTCALWELARRPSLVATIRAELATAAAGREFPTIDDVKSMPALNGFMLEIFRRYPVSMGIARALGQPLGIGGETFRPERRSSCCSMRCIIIRSSGSILGRSSPSDGRRSSRAFRTPMCHSCSAPANAWGATWPSTTCS